MRGWLGFHFPELAACFCFWSKGAKNCERLQVGYCVNMSVKARILWILPPVLVASWLAVRSLAALPAYGLEDPPLASAPSPIADPVLAQMISRFARDARQTHN